MKYLKNYSMSCIFKKVVALFIMGFFISGNTLYGNYPKATNDKTKKSNTLQKINVESDRIDVVKIAGWDHVTITSQALAPSFSQLNSALWANLSLADTIITVEYIYGSWPGRDNQERIRNFIKDAVTSHGTQYVLLGGDVEIVPYRKTWCMKYEGDWHDTIPCDLYYSDLDGDWDANGNGVFGEMDDSIDMYPDVWVGRVPVNTSDEILKFVDKFNVYCGSQSATYTEKLLLIGMNLDIFTQTELSMEYYCDNYIPSQYDITKVYYSQFVNHKQKILDALNDGMNICIHSDHSTVSATGYADRKISCSEMYSLTNAPKYSIFASIGCLHGAFDFSDCVVENFFNAPDGGTVLCMTNSRFGFYSPTQNPQRSRSFAYLEASVERIFQHSPASATDFFLSKVDNVGTAQFDTYYRWCMYALNLFGEPAMPIWTPHQMGAEESAERNITSSGLKLMVYPNPTGKNITIRALSPVNGKLTFKIYDISGREITRKTFSCLTEFTCTLDDILDNKKILSGVYFLTTETNLGKQVVNKITIIR